MNQKGNLVPGVHTCLLIILHLTILAPNDANSTMVHVLIHLYMCVYILFGYHWWVVYVY